MAEFGGKGNGESQTARDNGELGDNRSDCTGNEGSIKTSTYPIQSSSSYVRQSIPPSFSIEGVRWFKGVHVKRTVIGVWKTIGNVNKHLLKAKVNIQEKLRCDVGKGNKVNFWTDSWLNVVPLCESHQEIFRLAKNKKAKVIENYYKVATKLNWEWVRDPSTKEEWEEVGSIIRLLGEVVFNDNEDKWYWQNDFGVEFSVKTCRGGGGGSRVDFVPELWNDCGICRSFVSKMHGGKDNMVADMQMGKDSLPNNL
ncbi:hypothetical protein E3N88_25390 [Mikania micrantha]|uniref:Reverse transcriptase zinc-binding domain-containing protein n=1 Tax=Mikania micrantha TaxID=192012 RepID=A0A5N6N5K7_9ASTR|nr:hypothetical protein E3N88_25390 [Mikania micrantha]